MNLRTRPRSVPSRVRDGSPAPHPFRATVASLFCDTYVARDGANAYILLPELLTDRALAETPGLLFAKTARKCCFCEHDGIPAYRVRPKFVSALRKHGDNAKAIYNYLLYIFTESAVKRIFTMPNVWLLNHNAQAARLRATEECERNRLRKRDPAGFALHRQVSARVANRSASSAARDTRALQK